MSKYFDPTSLVTTNEFNNAESTASILSKADTLRSKKEEKIDTLSGRVGLSDTDRDGTLNVQTEDGFVDNMGNKVANEYTPEELQYLVGRTYKEMGVFEGPDGYLTYEDDKLVPFRGSEKDLASYYAFGTRGNDDVVKTGMWGSTDPVDRYTSRSGDEDLDRYDKPIGEEGVDVQKQDMNLLLPRGVNTLLENLQHGNVGALDNRYARRTSLDDPEYDAARERFGSGLTEAYTGGYVGAFGGEGDVSRLGDKEALWKGFQEKYGLGEKDVLSSIDYKMKRLREVGIGNREANVVDYMDAPASDLVGSVLSLPRNFLDNPEGLLNAVKGIPSTISKYTPLELSLKGEEFNRINDLVIQKANENAGQDSIWKSISTEWDKVKENLPEPVKDTLKTTKSVRDAIVLGLDYLGKKVGNDSTKRLEEVDFIVLNKVTKGVETNIAAGASPAMAYAKAYKDAPEAVIPAVAQMFPTLVAMAVAPYLTVVSLGQKEINEAQKDLEESVELLYGRGLTEEEVEISATLAGSATVLELFMERLIGSGAITKAALNAAKKGDMSKLAAAGVATLLAGATESLAEGSASILKAEARTLDKNITDKEKVEAIVGAFMGGLGGSASQAAMSSIDMAVNAKDSPSDKPAEIRKPVDDVDRNVRKDKYKKYLVEVVTTKYVDGVNLDSILDKVDFMAANRDAVSDSDQKLLKEADEAVNSVIDKIIEFVNNNPELKLTKRSIRKLGSGDVLGSESEKEIDKIAEEFEEGEYSDAYRAAVAEKLVHVVLGSGRSDDLVKANLARFAYVNNVDVDKINKIIKSYESVEQEATIEDRGYLTRENRIKSAVYSGNPDTDILSREVNELNTFYGSTARSISQLKQGIERAKEEADRLNALGKKYTTKTPKSILVKTDYKKLDGSAFGIYVSYDKDSNKWLPNVAEADKRIKEKEVTSKNIKNILREVNDLVSPFIGEVVSTGSYTVPGIDAGLKDSIVDARKADYSYIKNQLDTLKDKGIDGGINKVIVDDSPKGSSSKWVQGGDYRKSNLGIINTKEVYKDDYTSDDVVLVNAVGTRKNKKGFETSTLYNKDSLAGLELKSAMEAGATVVLDRDYMSNAIAKAGAIKFIERNDYIRVPGTLSFIPKTDENAREFKKESIRIAQKAAKDKKDKLDKEKELSKLVDMKAELLANKGANKGLQSEIDKYSKEMEDKYFSDGESTAKEKLDRWVNKELNKRIKNVIDSRRLEKEGLLKDNETVYEDLNVEKLADEKLQKVGIEESKIEEIITFWKDAVEIEGLSGRSLEKAINAKAKDLNVPIEAGSIIKTILNTSSVGVGKPPFWEGTYHVKNEVYGKWVTSDKAHKYWFEQPSDKELETFYKGSKKTSKGLLVPVSVKKVEIDTKKFTSYKKPTLINTIPNSLMPSYVKELAQRFIDKSNSALVPVSSYEKAKGEDLKGKSSKDGLFNLIDSPARSLMFGQSGVSPEVMTAMSVAVMDAVTTDRKSLSKGYKNVEQISAMFGVQPHEVTSGMIAFSKDVGSFKKTVSNSIGKNIAQLLGIGKKEAADLGYNTYERFIADLGNTAVLLGVEVGILEMSTKKSSDIADLLKDKTSDISTDFYHSGTTVSFINIKSTKKGNKYEISEKVLDDIKQFELISNKLPGFNVRKVGPSLRPFTKEEIEGRLNSVRNDAVGIEIPKEAKEALTTMMNTPYKMDISKVKNLLSIIDKNKNSVYKGMGYIDTDSKEYEVLSYEKKDIQESVNSSIEDSITMLSEFLKEHESKAVDGSLEMYFPFSFISNGRYLLDSNTINPQTNKLHRFLIMPSGNERSYTYKDGVFTEEGTGKKVSLLVRMALVQAFGVGIDKETTLGNIEVGNALLSLDKEGIDKLESDLINDGESSVSYKGSTYVMNAEHLSHSLDAIDFLRQSLKGKITSSISAEFDSLTSGFANKVQQLPILDDKSMHEHFARVGILTEEYLDLLKSKGFNVDVGKDGSVNDVLGGVPDFLDSYKNLAKDTVTGIWSKVDSLDKSKEVLDRKLGRLFKGILGTGVLPGGEYIGANITDETGIKIDSAMRNLFKYPFMIFNYSASISTIIKNLSNDIAKDIVERMAKADLNSESEDAKLVAYISSYNLVLRENGVDRPIKGSQLQKALRENTISSIIAKDFKKPLFSVLSDTMSKTYGKRVEEVFNEKFGDFIKVQDLTNDAFKVMFRIFDTKRLELVKERNKKGYLTSEDSKEILDTLWSDFPQIVGPLTSKEGIKDVIPVVKRDIGSPNEIEQAAKAPKSKFISGVSGVTINPLEVGFVEPISGGSVLPYHFIDGAQMGTTINDFTDYLNKENKKGGVLGIHDAVIGPITEADEMMYLYGKNMFEINKNYSIMENLKKMVDRINIENIDVSKVSTRGLSITKGMEDTGTFNEVVEQLKDLVDNTNYRVQNSRERWYGDKGPLVKARSANMIGGPGSVYTADGIRDTNYEKRFESMNLYKIVGKTETTEVTTKDSKELSAVKESFANMTETEKKAVRDIIKDLMGVEENTSTNKLIEEFLKDC